MHIQELFSLKGQTALILGGAGRIGTVISEGLAEAGAEVWIASRTKEKCEALSAKLTAAGHHAHSLAVDASVPSSLRAARDVILEHGGRMDIVVYCAVEWPMKGLFESSPEDWDRSMQTNARGVFLVSQVFGKSMADAGRGNILFIGSLYGTVAPSPKLYQGLDMNFDPDYYFHKGGMVQYTRFLASFLGPRGVRVNCLAPGGFTDNQSPAFVERYCERLPLGRLAGADDIKGAAVFLASSASQYITGATLPVDGGFTIV